MEPAVLCVQGKQENDLFCTKNQHWPFRNSGIHMHWYELFCFLTRPEEKGSKAYYGWFTYTHSWLCCITSGRIPTLGKPRFFRYLQHWCYRRSRLFFLSLCCSLWDWSSRNVLINFAVNTSSIIKWKKKIIAVQFQKLNT